jgi:hypothetical protein
MSLENIKKVARYVKTATLDNNIIKELSEYKQLISNGFKDITTPTKSKNNTFAFEIKLKNNYNLDSDVIYQVIGSGNIVRVVGDAIPVSLEKIIIKSEHDYAKGFEIILQNAKKYKPKGNVQEAMKKLEEVLKIEIPKIENYLTKIINTPIKLARQEIVGRDRDHYTMDFEDKNKTIELGVEFKFNFDYVSWISPSIDIAKGSSTTLPKPEILFPESIIKQYLSKEQLTKESITEAIKAISSSGITINRKEEKNSRIKYGETITLFGKDEKKIKEFANTLINHLEKKYKHTVGMMYTPSYGIGGEVEITIDIEQRIR